MGALGLQVKESGVLEVVVVEVGVLAQHRGVGSLGALLDQREDWFVKGGVELEEGLIKFLEVDVEVIEIDEFCQILEELVPPTLESDDLEASQVVVVVLEEHEVVLSLQNRSGYE